MKARFASSVWLVAFRNVFRQKGRTALTLSSIAAGVAGLILSGGFVEDALDQLRESTIHAQVGHLQVYKNGYHAKGRRSPFQYLIDRPEAIREVVDGLPQTRRTMSRLSFAGVLNNGKSDLAILGEGIEPAGEAAMGTQVTLIEGRGLTAGDRHGAVIGEGVATGSGVHPGDTVNLLLNTEQGALNNLEFTIVGVFRTASKDYDARAVRIPLAAAQELLDSKAVNAIVVELKSTASTDATAAVLRSRLDGEVYEVKTWLELADYYEKTSELFKRQFAFLQTIILLSVLLSVANSVNMTIFERTGEFGTLLALGTRRASIFRLVLLENVVVGLLGSALGVVLAVLLAWAINALQIPMPPPPNANGGYFAGIQLGFTLIVTAFAVGSLATPLTAVLPARRIARIPVVDALRMN